MGTTTHKQDTREAKRIRVRERERALTHCHPDQRASHASKGTRVKHVKTHDHMGNNKDNKTQPHDMSICSPQPHTHSTMHAAQPPHTPPTTRKKHTTHTQQHTNKTHGSK